MKTATLLATVASSSSVTSGAFDLGELKEYSAQIVFTGADVVGTLKLTCSVNGTNYVDVTGSSQAITASAGMVYNITDAQYRFFKVDWTYTSGTGNITITAIAKEPYKAST